METLVLSEADVYRLLPIPECIAVMRETLAALSRGQAFQPLRMVVPTPDRAGLLVMMPGYLSSTGSPDDARDAALGCKILAVFPANSARGFNPHQGAVLLMEADSGRLRAILNSVAITAVRTAAVSGVATDLLAREDAGEVALLGAGHQAWSHLTAMAAVRPVRRVRVWSRTPEHAQRFAAEQRQHYPFAIEVVPTAQEALRQADIVVTVTASATPVLKREWLADGAHINAVGACQPTTRELDTATVAAARLFVDRRESALTEAGDILIPMGEGVVTAEAIQAELGQVIIGEKPGRQRRDELTVFESLGLAIEDVAAAEFVFRRALETGAGARVEI